MRSNFWEKDQESSQSAIRKRQFGGRRSADGWMGERSVPRTVVVGCERAMERAQRPVPVAMSRTFLGFVTGAE